jgi:hypothetical protein
MSNLPIYDAESDPIINLPVQSKFYDLDSFNTSFVDSKQPILLSINIQSLNAKFEGLKAILNLINSKNVQVDVIALQETWHIKYSNLLSIPGYHNLFFKNRVRGRGGGGGHICKR